MIETNTSSLHKVAEWNWNSPTPYLFSGLLLVILLVAIALLILACSFQKRDSLSSISYDSGASVDHDEPPSKQTITKPKIVVVMAGDDRPTFLATPVEAVSSYQIRQCQCNTS